MACRQLLVLQEVKQAKSMTEMTLSRTVPGELRPNVSDALLWARRTCRKLVLAFPLLMVCLHHQMVHYLDQEFHHHHHHQLDFPLFRQMVNLTTPQMFSAVSIAS